ncbi:hypothetical protein LTR66_001807 [Elasticomyces elasticus]|nr:hypothetical protein LTR66_001807 [Elasticomyces elasticus]
MNSKSLRRLASDHRALHADLPPNYFFPPSSADAFDDLTNLDILLAGPPHTPYSAGLWKLHLEIPHEYPSAPPKASFRTRLWHPNVDEATGGVCVETLKRDWESKLTLRDVLVTISCLLIQPNPASALNAEAGALLQDNYDAFAQRARLMTSIHALVPKKLAEAAEEAQSRGEERAVGRAETETRDFADEAAERPRRDARRRRTRHERVESTKAESSSLPARPATSTRDKSRPFVQQSGQDDVFGVNKVPLPSRVAKPSSNPVLQQTAPDDADPDEEMGEADQENDPSISPIRPPPPMFQSPRRRGPAIPLGELHLSSDDEAVEEEYPPSPKKSPRKRTLRSSINNQESTGDEMNVPVKVSTLEGVKDRDPSAHADNVRARIVTPTGRPAPPIESSHPRSPEKRSRYQAQASSTSAQDQDVLRDTFENAGIGKNKGKGSARTPSPPLARKTKEQLAAEKLEAKLWQLCGQDVARWNAGDFDGFFPAKGGWW